MKTIYKYPLEVRDLQEIMMPKGAKILTVQVQRDVPCLWAEVESEAGDERRTFAIYGTGNPMDYRKSDFVEVYIGTFQVDGGNFVWHVYEIVVK